MSDFMWGKAKQQPHFQDPELLYEKWCEYKEICDNKNVMTHEFSAKNSEFVSKELKRSVTYTLVGFAVHLKCPSTSMYEAFAENECLSNIVRVIKDEIEQDVREKFEIGGIPTQLAALWMSKHGYSAKTDTTISGAVPVSFEGEADLSE